MLRVLGSVMLVVVLVGSLIVACGEGDGLGSSVSRTERAPGDSASGPQGYLLQTPYEVDFYQWSESGGT